MTEPARTTGVARFTAVLPAGSWKLEARYVSAAGIDYPQPLDAATVTIAVPPQAGGGGTAAPDAPEPET
jgi:hypothetical protein